ncbi:MAG: UvrD-helicase domain-containing protein, partial [Chloroflexi bacterium]|nr:UvrD-helicase domain-containing protein [Chloroflexota bacterium]
MSAPGAGTGNGQHSDDMTREQVRSRLDANLFVEAGAGTGKTDALVTRLSELLATGTAQPNEIAAITFTRAAAFEMRSRLRSALETRFADEADPAARERLGVVIDGLDGLAIQTIHAFALSMLREQPLDVGLPPVIEPLDDIRAAVEFDDRWSDWFRERVENDDGLIAALTVSQRVGLAAPVNRLKQLARILGERHQLLGHGMFTYDGPPPPPVSTNRLSEVLAKARQIVAGAPDPEDTMCRFVEETVGPELESLLTLAGDAPELPAEDFVDMVGIAAARRGSMAKWRKAVGGESALTALRDLLADLQQEIDQSRDLLKKRTVAALLTAATDFALEYAAHRRAGGRPTFHDQLVLARELLRSSEEARSRFRERYRFILVDEFQDTDPVQIELLRLLAGSGRGGLRPGSLFVVGDPKQSIYRFRGADPVSAAGFSEEVAASVLRLPLSENHRSLPGILKWVNTVFSGWMAEDEANGQAPYRELQWDPGDGGLEAGDVPVQWFGGESDSGADAARQLEFTQIASIAAAAGGGSFRVRDREGSWRDSTFADVAVLMKSRTGIDHLEDALVRADVPYVFDGQAPLFTSQDVRDLHACLTAIDDPADQVAVLAALRSPAFSCPDTDLLEWKQSGGGFAYGRGAAPETSDGHEGRVESVAAAFDELRRFHRLSRDVATATLVESFIRDRRLREKAALTRLGPERSRRLDLVVELANALSESDGITLREFTRWLERQSEENARMPERVSQGVRSGAVRVMTVHGAKGLEFPIVILASAMASGSNNRESVQVRTQKTSAGEERLEAQLGSKELGLMTAGAADAMEQEKAHGALEDVRLLYVAATRARDHLLVSRRRGKAGRNKPLVAEIERHLEGNEHLWREWLQPAEVRRPAARPAGAPATRAARDAWVSRRAGLVAAASLTGYTTPTALKPPSPAAGTPGREVLPKEPSESLDDEPGRTGRGATELGRAVHAVLQHIDLTGWIDDDLATLAERMAEEHGVGGEESQVAELARAALGTGTMARAAAAAKRGEAWREVSVAAALDGVTGELEGQIDLLFREEDGSLTVVD